MLVFVNGCFDGLHAGHIWFLEQARLLGDRLLVGVNSDMSIRQLKGPGRPLQREHERVASLQTLPCVDQVIVFDEIDPCELVRRLKPDILVKSDEYAPAAKACPERAIVEGYGGRVAYLPRMFDISTTKILEEQHRAAGSRD